MREADIAIVGAGLAGSTAAAMLAQAGHRPVLIDPHETYPVDFRCEKLDGSQVRLLRKTGLADAVLKAATPYPEIWVARFGRQLGLSAAVMAEMRRHSEKRIQARWDDLPLVPLRGLSNAPPLLVVHDRDDREVRFADGAAIAAAWPGARLLETGGLGHQRVLRDPAVVAAVAAFLAGDETETEAADEVCAHGRATRHSPCEACLLEHELFEPARRRAAGPLVSA